MSLNTYSTKEQVQKRHALIGKHKNQIPHGSKLMSFKYTLRIATDPQLLQWVMNLADTKGNPIECNIQYGYAYVFWDGVLGCWAVSYYDGRANAITKASDVERILTEQEHRNRYENLGYDSDNDSIGDYRESDYNRDDDRATWRK